MAERKLVLFKLGDENYGLDIEIVKGIEKLLPVVRIPNSVPYIEGIINLRGAIIPVLNLRKRFSLPEVADTDATEFLVTSVGDTMLAIKVDAVDSIYDLNAADIYETPVIVQTLETAYMKEVVLMEDKRLVIVLDAEELLSAQEKAAVRKMIDQTGQK